MFFPDGREWGEVHYVIEERQESVTPSGRYERARIEGHLSPLDRRRPLPFFDFMGGPQMCGALRLSDGRWWLCVFKNADGRVLNHSSGIRPPGPQPQPD